MALILCKWVWLHAKSPALQGMKHAGEWVCEWVGDDGLYTLQVGVVASLVCSLASYEALQQGMKPAVGCALNQS